MENGNVIEGETGFTYATLATEKARVKLEAQGMKGRGGSARLRMAKYFGMKSGSSHEQVVTRIEREMNWLMFEQTFAAREKVTPEQAKEIRRLVEKHGNDWKDKLQVIWETGRGTTPPLQQLRNQKGPAWLAGIVVKVMEVR